MLGIGFLLMHIFLVAISHAVLAESNPEEAFDYAKSPEPEVSRHEDEQLPDLQNSNVEGRMLKSHQECSCTYDYSSSFVKARVGQRRLKKGDSIMRGETVTFECRYVGTVLTWENGLRFYGRANMTCNTCEIWQQQHVPTCKSAQKYDVILGHEDDLAVFPDGTVQLQTGQNYRFSCSNVWEQPEWVYRKRDGVSVQQVEDVEEGESIFVSYLYVTHAEDEHIGIYECVSQLSDDYQALSAFLHIEVVRKSEIDETSSSTTPETAVSPIDSKTSPETAVSPIDSKASPEPAVSPISSTTSKPQEIPDHENDLECVCVYDSGPTSIKAFVGGKLLKRGGYIRHGETVYFQCHGRHVLSWENGLHYQGNARMTCSKCEVWTATDLPTCRVFPPRTYTVISSEEVLPFLPGGILQMKEGESHNISCVNAMSQPKWKYETKENFHEWTSKITRYHYVHLEIKHVKSEHRGKYECISATGESSVLNLKVDGKSINNENDRECACVYDAGPTSVKAFVGGKILQRGGYIRHGETVYFQCHGRHVLTWVNGLRYQGNARMTCSKCGVWNATDLPTCRVFPPRIYTVISSAEQLPFLPGGILQMKEGESHNISCVTSMSQPLWKYEAKDNFHEWTSRIDPRYYHVHLEIKNVKYEHRGKYECISATGESSVLNLKVDRKSPG